MEENESVAAPEAAETQEVPQTDTPVEGVEQEAPEPKEEKVVPLAALHEERQRRRELQAQLTAQNQQYSTLNQRLDWLAAKAQQDMYAQQPRPPQLEQDPLGSISYEQQQIKNQLSQVTHHLGKQQQENLMRQQADQIVSTVRQADAEFKARQPDAHEAMGFLRQRKYAEYVAAGASPEQARQGVERDEWQLCTNALQQGVNPAERAYEIAKATGYVAPTEKLAMQQKGQQASTPSSAGGRGGGKISLDALLKMDSAEFTKATEGNNWRKLVGG